MNYLVRHRTTYRYLQDVSYSRQLLHLRPRNTQSQKVTLADVAITPEPSQRIARDDAFGNHMEWLALDDAHAVLDIVAESRVSVTAPAPRDPAKSKSWEEVRALIETPVTPEAVDAVQYSFDSQLTAFTADVAGYAKTSFPPGTPIMAGAIDLMARIHKDFRYDTTVTDATTPVDRVFEIRAGVCQDLAHVGIAAMRALGLPARYISGYLMTKPPPGQEKMLGADASHAWFSVWAPPYGWVDLDPTNNVLPAESHVTVGWGRDYGDVAPINGVVTGGGDHVIEVGVDVLPQQNT